MSSRIYLIRHGATEWSRLGKHTSTSEVPLTEAGEREVAEASHGFVGEGKLIDPHKVVRIYCSPRGRARRTAELLKLGTHEHQHYQFRESGVDSSVDVEQTYGPTRAIQITPLLQEWDYGDFEGMTIEQVHQFLKEKGQYIGRNWNIWQDGCAGGESPHDVSNRLDELIYEIKDVIAKKTMESPGTNNDVVCVGHGHILAALALRWAQQPLKNGMRLLNEPCGVAVLGFEHDDMQEPAIIMGRRHGH